LNYGLLEDSIDNNVINSFNSYEYLIEYKLENLNEYFFSSIGFVYSQIENYKSDAILFNIKKEFKIKKINASFSLDNFGIILNSYTSIKQNSPYKIQFSLNDILLEKEFNFGYNLVYNNYLRSPIHIISLSKNFNNFFKFRISNSTNYKKLKIYNDYKDYLYGFSIGFTLYTNTNKAIDVGFLNLGPAGYVYGITLNI
tara:strand:+ start:2606 stop:3199 length:594 start_codon:yes stop_codon:yes gene_type:complete